MNEHLPPSTEDLNRYVVLIRFLHQVHSQMQAINEETEKFNGLIRQQPDLFERIRLSVEDLTASMSDCEELKRTFTVTGTESDHA